jgi:glycerophosphoryl diester phosphodiesterase
MDDRTEPSTQNKQGGKQPMTLITAHAGAMGTAPNTPESLDVLLASGADAVEVDVRRRGSNLLLSHDLMLPWKKYPSLPECLLRLRKTPEVLMNLDFKEPGLVRDALRIAREHGVADRLLYTGDVGGEDFQAILGSEIPLWLNEYLLTNEERKDPVSAAAKRGFEILNIDRKRVTDILLRENADRLSVWTVNEEDELRRLLLAGVKNITTRNPALALQLREEIQG